MRATRSESPKQAESSSQHEPLMHAVHWSSFGAAGQAVGPASPGEPPVPGEPPGPGEPPVPPLPPAPVDPPEPPLPPEPVAPALPAPRAVVGEVPGALAVPRAAVEVPGPLVVAG